ncbi:MAG: transporter substrate-binding domain-containing protein [Rhodospirillaceae bacterium]|nr:transporter substrate-binding domain-containing protein [Rhodospirillaceae bacterium]MBL6932738.1 transporter substrate-binding domain-containing protein [Rhodospirillales bacterium]
MKSALGILAVGAGLALSATLSSAQEELEYAYPDISVWTTKRDSNGNLKNPLVRLATPLFEKAGIPWHPKDYPALRLFENLRTGVAKFSMLVNAPALKGCCLLSKDPVAVVEIRVYRRHGAKPITRREDFNGKDVISIRGYSYAGVAKYINDPQNNITNYAAGDHHAAFAMLKARRADYVIDYAFPAEEVLSENPIPGVTFDSLSQTNVYLVLHKHYPDAKATMARLEAIMKTLDKSDFLTPPGTK